MLSVEVGILCQIQDRILERGIFSGGFGILQAYLKTLGGGKKRVDVGCVGAIQIHFCFAKVARFFYENKLSRRFICKINKQFLEIAL